MKKLCCFLFIFFSVVCVAQTADFILLKQKDRTIKTFFTGSPIRFTSTNGVYVEANITAIKNDTLFLQQYVIRQVPTQLGVYVLDTSYYYNQYHYNQIKAIGKSGRRFDVGGSGAALMGGGILLSIASGVVYLADNKKFSPELLAAAVGLTGVGFLLSKQAGKGMMIGKKYSLVYVKAASDKRD